MIHDTSSQPFVPNIPPLFEPLHGLFEQFAQEKALGRGRPREINLLSLGLACVWAVLDGKLSQRRVWRLLCAEGLFGFPLIDVCGQAISKCLAQHSQAIIHALGTQFATAMHRVEAQRPIQRLAPFASAVIAFDESAVDDLFRWLKPLRPLSRTQLNGTGGRLLGWFDVRRQAWHHLSWLPDRLGTNEGADWFHLMKAVVPPKALLLFDRGYRAFEWFDQLTAEGFFWITRLTEAVSMEPIWVIYESATITDRIVYLGNTKADRARYAVRMVRILYRGTWYSYMSNVTNPYQLSAADMACLYTRRWDIELAFRLLKDHLGLMRLWSAKWEVVAVQLMASLIAAQLVHTTQVLLAAQEGIDVFDISVEVLLEYLPTWIKDGVSPFEQGHIWGRKIGIIRPSTRRTWIREEISLDEIAWPPQEVQWERQQRYGKRMTSEQKQARKRKNAQKSTQGGKEKKPEDEAQREEMKRKRREKIEKKDAKEELFRKEKAVKRKAEEEAAAERRKKAEEQLREKERREVERRMKREEKQRCLVKKRQNDKEKSASS